MPRLAALHIHPVKSMRALSLERAEVEPWGLAGDRRWMVTAPGGRFLTQREHPRLALLTAEPLPGGGLRLTAPDADPLHVDRPAAEADGGTPVAVRVWGDDVTAVAAAAEADAWLAKALGTDVRLVHLDDPAVRRPTDPAYSEPGDRVSFADGFPLLLTSTASLDALNDLIAADDGPDAPRLPMNRFRPNAVVDAAGAWDEDHWRRVRIGTVEFRVVKPCGRCVVTTTDQRTAERGAQPLRALGRHRRFGTSLVFGQNLVPDGPGTLRVGDPVEILERA